MKKVLFIVSHLFSGSSDLIIMLNANPRIRISETETTYASPEDLESLWGDDPRICYGDHLLFNTSFWAKQLYGLCKFVYVIRPPKPTLNLLKQVYPLKIASNHYCFRIRRIYEMARRTPNAVFLTTNDVITGKWASCVEQYVNMEVRHLTVPDREIPDEITPSELKEAEECYEKYLYRLKSYPLIVPSS